MAKGRLLIRTFVLDSEGISKAATGDLRVREILERARRDRIRIVASAVTLAEVLRGHARDAGIHRVLTWIRVDALTPELGKQAGKLLGRTRLPGRCTIDAMVAATAMNQERPSVILTSDPQDLSQLVENERGIGVLRV